MAVLERMIEFGHERVAFHQDAETGLRAIIALHSTVLGPALGGTRRWHYSGEAEALNDVLRLSQGMTYKCACAGLKIGGGKSVIMLPEAGHRATEAEARAMGRFVDTFQGMYIAAEDVGVDTNFVDGMALETKYAMGGEKVSRGGDPSPFTARGVVNGMRAAVEYTMQRTDLDGLTVAIQGLGSVGSYLTRLLTEAGAKIIGADIRPDAVERCVDEFGISSCKPDEILLQECDVLAPCALGGVIDANLARKLNCRIVCGGANNVLDDPDEDAVVLKHLGITYAPDFVVNAGGVIQLAGLYLNMTQDQLDEMNDRIYATTLEILRNSGERSSTHASAVAMARQRIAEGAKVRKSAATQEQVHAG